MKSFKCYMHHIKSVSLLTLFMWIVSVNTYGQFYETGQDPSSTRWKQIKTDHYNLIFPDSFSIQAQRMANVLEHFYPAVTKTIKTDFKKFPVIIHTQSVYSNGFVVWAPRRMEIWTTPPQDIYAQEWLEQLAIHESRHIAQINNLNQGFTRVLSWLAGEQAVGGVTSFLPRWYYEGDAVAIETAYSLSGRGRSPAFEQEMRTQVMQKKLYVYEKAVMGSFKDHVANQYELGYPIVAYARDKYGADVWNKTENFIARNPYTIIPFFWSLRKYTGESKRSLYKDTYSYLDSIWESQDAMVTSTEFEKLNNKQKYAWTNYKFPQEFENGIVAEKSGIDQIKIFVAIDSSGREKTLFTPGFYTSLKLSASKGKIVWAENIPDPRWSNRDYSVIKIYDHASGKTKSLQRKTRLFAPSISKDGNKVAAIEITMQNQYSLVVLDANTGEYLSIFSSPQNKYLQLPEWDETGTYIYLASLHENGKSFDRVNVENGTWEEMLAPTFKNIMYASPWKNYIFFAADYSGIENIYAINTRTKKQYQVTSSRFGATFPEPSLKDEKLYYSNYTANGYDIAHIAIDPLQWKPVEEIHNNGSNLYKTLLKQEDTSLITSEFPTREYEVRRYSKAANLFNVHSWIPFYYNYENISFTDPTVYPGITFLSQNKLTTAFSRAGVAFFDQKPHLFSSFEYKGWYPVFRIGADYGGSPRLFPGPREITRPVMQQDNLSLRGKVYVPLNFTTGKFIKGLQPSMEIQFTNDYFYREGRNLYSRNMVYMNYRLQAYSYLKSDQRDLYPKWGLLADIRYSDTPFENEAIGSITTGLFTQYIPGIFRNQGLKLMQGIQHQNPNIWLYSTKISFPRGYINSKTEDLRIFTADYSFPILYPDLQLTPLLYIKRIRGTVFADIAQNKYREYNQSQNKYEFKTENLKSYGGEILLDFHGLQFLFPLAARLRYSYMPDEKAEKIELIFNVDMTSF